MSIIRNITCAALVAIMAITGNNAVAQNLQSASNNSRMHANLLARQQRVQEQIKLEESQKYASGLYQEEEPEPDIYTEGWDSGRVNPFKEEDVPDMKVINVRNYVMPIKSNYVTSHYGYRPRFGRNHKGVDLRCPLGDTVRSAFSGRVRLTKYERNGYGFYVIVRHENGLETVYGHLSRFLVQPNQYVKAGQPIALSGSTGRSTGPHLHFETRFMGYAINPEAIFDFEHRVTHTDTYTFRKSTYTQARSNTPGRSASATPAKQETVSYATTQTITTAASVPATEARSTYKVRSGDTIEGIASRNGVTVAQIKRMNGLSGNTLRTGQVLKIK